MTRALGEAGTGALCPGGLPPPEDSGNSRFPTAPGRPAGAPGIPNAAQSSSTGASPTQRVGQRSAQGHLRTSTVVFQVRSQPLVGANIDSKGGGQRH